MRRPAPACAARMPARGCAIRTGSRRGRLRDLQLRGQRGGRIQHQQIQRPGGRQPARHLQSLLGRIRARQRQPLQRRRPARRHSAGRRCGRRRSIRPSRRRLKWATVCSASVVLPQEGPKISTMAPRGNPPVSRAAFRGAKPVDTVHSRRGVASILESFSSMACRRSCSFIATGPPADRAGKSMPRRQPPTAAPGPVLRRASRAPRSRPRLPPLPA